MDYFSVILLGLVQGATEFLPVSSTAHLIILPRFFNFPDPGLVFDISLHLGTLLSVLIYFRREWEEMLREAIKLISGGAPPLTSPVTAPLVLLSIATIPAVIFGLLFEGGAEGFLRNPLIIAFNLMFFGLILWLVDIKTRHFNDMKPLSVSSLPAFGRSGINHCSKKEALFIGLWQALAIIPGVSRSGASITGGLLVGLKREEAVKFSFLISVPIIFISSLLGVYEFFLNRPAFTISTLVLGIFTSFISGLLAIKFLIKFTQKSSFTPFVIYRIVLAILILMVILKG